MQFKPRRHSKFLMVLLSLFLLLAVAAACDDEGRPTRVPQLSMVAPTFAPLIETLPPPVTTNNPAGGPPPTPADPVGGNTLPKFNIFITPPPLATFEAARNYGERGRISVSDLKPENLAQLNGVPIIPYLSPPQQKQPVITQRRANYGDSGRPRVGLQVGHLEINKLPEEWAALRGQTGGSGGGYTEVQINYDIARRVAALLISRGVTVDLIPATVPPSYTADVFVAIHCDAVSGGGPSGFKLARSEETALPRTDDSLVATLYSQYEQATGLPRDGNITSNMTGYYSFNGPYRNYAISKITPGAIIELGYLTNATDRNFLVNRPDDSARGVANGIIIFLNQRPALEQRELPISLSQAIEARLDRTPVYDSPDGSNIVAYVSRQQVFTDFANNPTAYGVLLPVLDRPGFIRKTDAALISVPR